MPTPLTFITLDINGLPKACHQTIGAAREFAATWNANKAKCISHLDAHEIVSVLQGVKAISRDGKRVIAKHIIARHDI